MVIRRFLLLFLSVFALSVPAFSQSVSSDGHVVYKMPSGELVTRDVTLEVPMRGEGDVYLIGGDQRVKAAAFKSKTFMGRTVFAIAFMNAPGAPEGSTGVFVGSVLHGTNEVMYYGDIYMRNEKSKGLVENWDDVTHNVTYLGGFHFTKKVEVE